jgi:hypothetical protein
MENNEENPILPNTLEKYYEDIVKTALVGEILTGQSHKDSSAKQRKYFGEENVYT